MAWTKGKSGNPNGRPNDKPFLDTLRFVLKETSGPEKLTKLRRITDVLVDKALEGESWAVQHVMDRVDGKAHQTAEITVDDKRDNSDWTRSELVALLSNARDGSEGAVAPVGCSGKPN